MTATNHAILKPDRRSRLRYSKEQKSALVDAYQSSGLSGPRFAALHGMNYQTLAGWLQKHKRPASPIRANPPQPAMLLLVEAEIQAMPPAGAMELILPGSAKLTIAAPGHIPLAAALIRELANLYQIESRLRETQSSPVLRETVRAAQSRPIHQRLKKLIDKLALRLAILPKSDLGKAICYALNQWPNLQTYLRDGRVEIDNPLVENAIRPTKHRAKNWLFIGREDAGEKSAIIYPLVENCRRLGINPRDYFEGVLTRLPAMLASEAASLTPANWLAARSKKARRAAA